MGRRTSRPGGRRRSVGWSGSSTAHRRGHHRGRGHREATHRDDAPRHRRAGREQHPGRRRCRLGHRGRCAPRRAGRRHLRGRPGPGDERAGRRRRRGAAGRRGHPVGPALVPDPRLRARRARRRARGRRGAARLAGPAPGRPRPVRRRPGHEPADPVRRLRAGPRRDAGADDVGRRLGHHHRLRRGAQPHRGRGAAGSPSRGAGAGRSLPLLGRGLRPGRDGARALLPPGSRCRRLRPGATVGSADGLAAPRPRPCTPSEPRGAALGGPPPGRPLRGRPHHRRARHDGHGHGDDAAAHAPRRDEPRGRRHRHQRAHPRHVRPQPGLRVARRPVRRPARRHRRSRDLRRGDRASAWWLPRARGSP